MVRIENRSQRRIQSHPVSTSILLIAVLGCTSKAPPERQSDNAKDPIDKTSSLADRRILTRGPHDGHLFRLGNGEYYAEMTHDTETQTVVVYLLEKNAQVPVACEDAEIVLHLLADRGALTVCLSSAPQECDPRGQSTRYYAMDAELSEALDDSQIIGRISLTLRGTPYGNAIIHERHAYRHDGKAN